MGVMSVLLPLNFLKAFSAIVGANSGLKKLNTIKRQIALMLKNVDVVENNCLGK